MIALRHSEPGDTSDLLRIWCRAVDASHDFLSAEDRVAIGLLVADYVRTASLVVAILEDRPIAFMGVTGQHIDSLFVDPSAHGLGIGRLMTDTVGRPTTVDVNEQNDGAIGFYGHLGFEVTGRSEFDDQGRPYPLLHLRRR
jgi:putative acetyltransferase